MRDRVLYNLIFFALLMMGAAVLVGEISIGIEHLVIINLGLTAISIFGIVMAVFIGVGLVYKEIDKTNLVRVAGAADPALGISDGKIRRIAGDAGCEYRVDDGGPGGGAALCEPRISSDGFFDAGGHLFYSAGTGAGHRAGSAVLLFLFADDFDDSYDRPVHCRSVFAGHPGVRGADGQFGCRRNHLGTLLRAAEFPQLQCARRGGAWRSDSRGADHSEYAVRRRLHCPGVVSSGGNFLTPRFEVKWNATDQAGKRGLPSLRCHFLLAALFALQEHIDERTHSLQQQKEELVLNSGKLIQKLSLGYGSLLADIYWTRAVQYYGERVGIKGTQFDLLGRLLDISTTLDPHLLVAYRYGAIFLAEPPTVGAGRPDLAVALLRKGIEANPDEWSCGRIWDFSIIGT